MAGARFTAVPGLDAMVAAMIQPALDRVIDQVADLARRNAPPTKTWESMQDAQVRETHVRAHGQEVPNNLRHTVKSMPWDQKHRGLGEFTYMIAPKDETSKAVANIRNCRCVDKPDPNGIAKLIDTQKAKVEGTRVAGAVTCEGNLVVQAEYGDVYPGGLVADGTHFMAKTAAEMKARLKL